MVHSAGIGIDWDPLDPTHEQDPFGEHDRLRSSSPVAFSDRFDGFWSLTRYADVVSVTKDPETFASRFKTTIPDSTGPQRPPRPPLETDPPVHGFYRSLLNRYFTPSRIRALEPGIRRIAQDLVGAAVAEGETECVATITFPMPAQVLCSFLGIPSQDAARIKSMATDVLEAGIQGDRQRHQAANDAIYTYIGTLITNRRSRPLDPATDVTSGLLEATLDGRPLTEAEVASVLRLLLQAGHGTTSNGLGSVIAFLAERRDVQDQLRQDHSLIPQAIEEILRLWSPTRLMARTATRDVDMHDRRIPSGSKVALMYTAANRDPEVFDQPNDFVLDRSPNRHVAFGNGIHACIGASLARAELRVAIEELLTATETFQLVEGVKYAGWPHIGPAELKVAFTPVSVSDRSAMPLPPGARELQVRSKRRLGDRTIEFVLAAEDGVDLPSWQPGAHIELHLPNGLSRQFSLCGRPEARDEWTVAVQRDDDSRGGASYLHEMVSEGDWLQVVGPRNHFPLEPANEYVLMAAGIGITPIMAMARQLSDQGKKFSFHYIGKGRQSMVYLPDLAREIDNIQIHETRFSRPDLGALVAEAPRDASIYACGPVEFLTALESLCDESNRDFHVEWFSPKPQEENASDGALESFKVRVASTNELVDVQPGQSIIDACAEAGVSISGSCFEGTCGSCETRVLAGTPAHRDSVLSKKQRAVCDVMMPCVSRSFTEELTLEA